LYYEIWCGREELVKELNGLGPCMWSIEYGNSEFDDHDFDQDYCKKIGNSLYMNIRRM